MSKKEAAEELIRATDNARELSKVGRLTRTDVERVKDANDAYNKAK